MKGEILVLEYGNGAISCNGATDSFERVGADAAEQLGWRDGERVRVEVEDAERFSVHGERLDYD